MSNLIHRSQKATSLAADAQLPKWQRLAQALQAFAGLELTDFPVATLEPFEADLAGVNQVLSRYALETVADYERISDADLDEMLQLVEATASRAIAAELDRLVAALDAGVEKLPVDAIREVRQHRGLMIPRLIQALRDAISAARADNVPEGNAHFFAIFLLTEFGAEEAFPVILEAFSLPGDLPFDLFGDAVTGTLARILARFAGDRPAVIDAMINDRALNEYVRWEAAQCYVYLVRDGRLSREEAVQALQRHLRQAIDQNDERVIGGLICVLEGLAPKEALDDITEAYQRGLVDPRLIDMESVERSIAEGERRVREELRQCPATGIADTIEELQTWAAFQERPSPPPRVPHSAMPRKPVAPPPVPVEERSHRVGRNDPCPCGSGKKYKKCCGSHR
jgi:hypothetical protein